MLGVEFPICAFSHCRDVVAAVTNAGGFGILGAVAHSPERLENELTWIEEQTGGKPYGVDLLLPPKYVGAEQGRDRRRAGPGAAARGAPRVRRRLAGPLRHRGARRRAACVRRRPQHLAQGLRAAARRGLRPRHPADRQRAGAAAGRPRRARPRPRRAGGRAGRHHATRAAARGRGCRPDRRAGHRGRRPHRRGGDHGAGPRGRRRGGADPGAGRRRDRPRPPDRRGPGPGRRGRVVRVGVADHRRSRDAPGGQGQVLGRQLLGHGAVAVDDRQAGADAAHGLDRRVGRGRTPPTRSACRCRPR